MCLIIHKPAGVEIPATLIKSAWEDNSDGAGIMYHKAGEPTVYKVLPTGAQSRQSPVDHLTKVLAELNAYELGVHFRWRTHGPINYDNTHPYRLPGNTGYLMHNGVLSGITLGKHYEAVKDVLSDTGFYVLTSLQNAPDATNSQFWELVGADVGPYNRMLVMDAVGRFLRVNDKQWEDYKGLKLSNVLSCPEYTGGYGRKYWLGWDFRDSRTSAGYGSAGADMVTCRTDGKVDEEDDSALIIIGTSKRPARLTRRERKALNAVLRAGNWGPLRRLTRNA